MCSKLWAQIGLIYVSPGSFLDKDNLITELRNNKELLNNANTLSFISNDKIPLIGLYADDFLKNLNKLKEIKPSAPVTYFEVDTLNNILQFNTLQNEDFILHIYSDFYTAKNSIVPFLIQRLLLCNDLMDINGPKKNVKVVFHLKIEKSQNPSQIRKYFNDFKYEVNFL